MRAEVMCRPVPRLSTLTRAGEVPYAEPLTADEVRALAAQVRRRMRARTRGEVDLHSCLAEAARERGLVEVEGCGVLALKASAALTPRRGLAFEVTPADAGGPMPIFVQPRVMMTAAPPAEADPMPVKVKDILAFISDIYQIPVRDLISQRRTKHLIPPRQIAAWLAKTLTLRSLPYIGDRMGGRDHTTILHAVRKIEARRQRDADFAAWLETLKAAFCGADADKGGGIS